ncbi:hypothetical protein M404DRAFT_187167 [Pisolithus tinctorius Marx 270]|uniref:Uncharacterized protein n=1 Tax=Pisolithus tinctorius Marx 270 TaxID=870435 RepID=A0A0C3K036_PISTI|nr:hypothetical protein M404DRAFT_187167 [Pisolithus tinctorius Marx 270]
MQHQISINSVVSGPPSSSTIMSVLHSPKAQKHLRSTHGTRVLHLHGSDRSALPFISLSDIQSTPIWTPSPPATLLIVPLIRTIDTPHVQRSLISSRRTHAPSHAPSLPPPFDRA